MWGYPSPMSYVNITWMVRRTHTYQGSEFWNKGVTWGEKETVKKEQGIMEAEKKLLKNGLGLKPCEEMDMVDRAME